MEPSRHVTQMRSIGAVVLLALTLLAPSASPSELLGTNVRPFFAVGPSVPVGLDGGRTGFGMSLGFEAEESAMASVLFRLEWQRFERQTPPSPYYDSNASEVTVVNWSLGGRVHLRRNETWRPYGEACLGVRLGDGTGDGGFAMPLFGPTAGIGPLGEGLAMTLRMGISSAAHGRAGFFLDSGMDVLLRGSGRYGIVPARLGVVFP